MTPGTRVMPQALPRALWLIPAVYFLFVTGEFLALTTLVLTLTDQGASALRVGLLGSTLWLGILCSSLVAHRVVNRFGHAPVFVGASALALASMLALPLAAAEASPADSTYIGWLVAVGVLGVGGGLVWVAGESWLAEAAPAARRGFYVGLFETSVGLALMTGPALLPLALALGVPALWLAAALLASGVVCSVWLLGEAPSSLESIPMPADAAAAARPATPLPRWIWPLLAVAAAGGVLESGISAMLPSISMRLGFELQLAAWLGVVIGAGSALLQPPFGALADRIGMARAMALAWALVLAALLALLALAETPRSVLWIAGFVLGGVGGAVYTLVVIELGHRLTGSALVKAMGALVTGYTLGTAGAPAAGGWLFDRAGLAGLAAALLAVAIFGAALAWRALRTPPAAD